MGQCICMQKCGTCPSKSVFGAHFCMRVYWSIWVWFCKTVPLEVSFRLVFHEIRLKETLGCVSFWMFTFVRIHGETSSLFEVEIDNSHFSNGHPLHLRKPFPKLFKFTFFLFKSILRSISWIKETFLIDHMQEWNINHSVHFQCLACLSFERASFIKKCIFASLISVIRVCSNNLYFGN